METFRIAGDWHAQAVLTCAEMGAADAAAIAAGTPGIVLMENACAAVTRAIRARWAPRPTLVLCGPGNNGGDGFGVAIALARHGWPVTLALWGSCDALTGDAAIMAERWQGPVVEAVPDAFAGHGLVVDALFGAGLSRDLDGVPLTLVEALAAGSHDVVAIDVPSGLDGDTGEVRGAVAPAGLTVTFFRPKPGHLLSPGRGLCGELVVGDIGIPPSVLDAIAPTTAVNGPRLWRSRLPRPMREGHKYHRGHALVVGGETTTGAARLAARSALAVGAGLVTVAAPGSSLPVYAEALESVMVSGDDFATVLGDIRKNAVLVGPGNGVGAATHEKVMLATAAGRRVVLDADALTSFADDRDTLFAAVAGCPSVLTPHDGEYARLFAASGDRLARARAAAAEARTVVALKGPETVIAAPDGRAVIESSGPADLATAGTGDVLAGLITGLMAAGAVPFDAAGMAAWIHAAAGCRAGVGLVSENLPEHVAAVLAALS
ncbi:MAG: NAD(P)H-hydrate dehydratase [Alphaproteobacteria bacterium]|nr:NAD(P)H-hydrate dehydratase [Alphaproteobacteria bacterium]